MDPSITITKLEGALQSFHAVLTHSHSHSLSLTLTHSLTLTLTQACAGSMDDVTHLFQVSLFTRVTGPRRSLSLKLSDTRVYAPHIRARLGTTAHFCEVVAPILPDAVEDFGRIRGGDYSEAPSRRMLKLRAVPIGTVLNLRTTASQKCEAVPRRARI